MLNFEHFQLDALTSAQTFGLGDEIRLEIDVEFFLLLYIVIRKESFQESHETALVVSLVEFKLYHACSVVVDSCLLSISSAIMSVSTPCEILSKLCSTDST